MKNAIIMPYDNGAYPLLKYELEDYNVIGCIAPKGWGTDKKDSGKLSGFNKNGVLVNDIEEELFAVILVKSDIVINFNLFIMKSLEKYKENIIEVYFFMDISINDKQKLIDWCNKNNIIFKENVYNSLILRSEILYDIAIPIVFVTGLVEGVNKFIVQMELVKDLESKDLKVSFIGTKEYTELFGYSMFPNFMFDDTLSNKEKILKFNLFIKKIEVIDKPDIIVIGIPKELMILNKEIVCNFSEINFLVSSAINPDSVIVVLPIDNYNNEYFKSLGKHLRYKFGYYVDAYIYSNISLNTSFSNEFKELRYITLEKEEYKKQFEFMYKKNDIYDISGEYKKASNAVIEALSNDEFNELI